MEARKKCRRAQTGERQRREKRRKEEGRREEGEKRRKRVVCKVRGGEAEVQVCTYRLGGTGDTRE